MLLRYHVINVIFYASALIFDHDRQVPVSLPPEKSWSHQGRLLVSLPQHLDHLIDPDRQRGQPDPTGPLRILVRSLHLQVSPF